MLIIAIGYEPTTDGFSCSATPDTDLTGEDVKPYLDFICKAQNLQPEWVSEILVVEVNSEDTIEVIAGQPYVSHHFGADDGLGEGYSDLEEDA